MTIARKKVERVAKVVTVRMTETEYRALQKQAAGHSTVSDLVRSRVLGGGIREPLLLKQVAALSALGGEVRDLADQPGLPRAELLAVLDRIGNAIDALAGRGAQ